MKLDDFRKIKIENLHLTDMDHEEICHISRLANQMHTLKRLRDFRNNELIRFIGHGASKIAMLATAVIFTQRNDELMIKERYGYAKVYREMIEELLHYL